jgi:hypothetical protein
LAQQRQFRTAIQTLERILAEYPQDFALRLELGWLAFQAEDWTAAGAYYRSAAELSPEALEPRLGIAWTQLRSGDPEAAQTAFRSILAQAPEHASAKQGLALCETSPGLALSAGGALGFLTRSGIPGWKFGGSIAAGLGLTTASDWAAGATYRYSYFPQPGQPGMGSGRGAGFSQHEVYLATGYTGPRVGVLGQYAYQYDGSATGGQAHVVGLSGRHSWQAVALLLDISDSLYSDRNILRLAPSLDLALGATLVLQPTLALQYTRGDWLPNVALRIVFQWDGGSIWLGGKLGEEERPAYLHTPAIYNIDERIAWGTHLGLQFAIGQIHLGLAWELSALSPAVDNAPAGLLNIVTLTIDRLPEERTSAWTP